VTQDSAGPGRGAHAIVATWQFLDLFARGVLARVRTTCCDDCAQPIRWWNRRVWLVSRERCSHLQCWNVQLFQKQYVQFMSEEIRNAAQLRIHIGANDSDPAELMQLRTSARALRERIERLEAQLQRAEELAVKMHVGAAAQNGRLSMTREKEKDEGNPVQ
jgi:hypothetical protein